jgi:hypothetical protein
MDLTTYSDTDLHDLSAGVAAEWDRRRAEPHIAEVIVDLRERGDLTGPEAGADTTTAAPWQDPGTDHSRMYQYGAFVTHDGRVWESLHPGLNHWTPGTQGAMWVDRTPTPIDEETGEPQTIAWGVGQDVQPGDLRTHDGQTWECILAHTTHEGWAPGPATHAVWKPVTP